MTKLIDIPGAREALPFIDILECPCGVEFSGGSCPSGHDLEPVKTSVHLEVDVEAMAKSMYESEEHLSWKNLPESYKPFWRDRAKRLVEDTLKWARLVRK